MKKLILPLFVVATIIIVLSVGLRGSDLISTFTGKNRSGSFQFDEMDNTYLELFYKLTRAKPDEISNYAGKSKPRPFIKRNPFLRPKPGLVQDSNRKKRSGIFFQLSGIMWHEKSPQAIVNNNIVKQGSYVDNFQVHEIGRRKVILKSTYRTIVLQLPVLQPGKNRID